jgi:hypothetical protein
MKITWYRDSHKMSYLDKVIDVVCDVRNELNGQRALSEKPVYSENEDGGTGVPYMPRPFPIGSWEVVSVIPKTDPYEAPEFISTDAHQPVEEWTEVLGHYGQKTGTMVEDYGYGLHNSTSNTTLGCGRISRPEDRENLVMAIQDAWAAGETVTLVVSEG